MSCGQLHRKVTDSLGRHHLGCLEQDRGCGLALDVFVDSFPELIRLDHPARIEHGLAGAINLGVVRDQYEGLEFRLKAEAQSNGKIERGANVFQHRDVPLVLLQGRFHPFIGLAVFVPAEEFAFFRNLDPAVELLGFEYIDLGKAVQQQMIDLRDAPALLEAQVMDDGPVLRRFAEVEIDEVGRIMFALDPGLEPMEIALGLLARDSRQPHPCFQRRKVCAFIVRLLDQHAPVPIRGMTRVYA